MAIKVFSGDKIEELETRIKDMQREVKILARDIKDQQLEYDAINKKVNNIVAHQEELTEQLQRAIESISSASRQLEKASIEIATFRPVIEKKMLNGFTQTIEKELATATNKIYAEAAGFSAAKETFKEHIKNSKEAMSEITKLKDIIGKLDAKDFELEAYAKKLQQHDQEKLRLMKRVDELESMLAKMKRSKK